jgi:hypothetical protein
MTGNAVGGYSAAIGVRDKVITASSPGSQNNLYKSWMIRTTSSLARE